MDWSVMPPLSSLRAFAAYAATGAMTAAGRQLNVSHAAISQQIRGLEAHLGLTLVDRDGGPGELTDEGRVLAEAVGAGFQRIHRAVEELTGADAGRPVQVTTTASFASNWLMPRLAGFRARHPEISLMIDPSPELRPLRPGGIDMAIRFGAGDWPGLESTPMIPTPIVVVAAHSLVGDAAYATPGALADFPWMQELGTTEASDYMARHGAMIAPARGVTHLPGNMMIEAARDGQGIAVIARAFVEGDIAAGRLRLLFEGRPGTGYHLVTRPGVMRAPARSFHRWLTREAAGGRGGA